MAEAGVDKRRANAIPAGMESDEEENENFLSFEENPVDFRAHDDAEAIVDNNGRLVIETVRKNEPSSCVVVNFPSPSTASSTLVKSNVLLPRSFKVMENGACGFRGNSVSEENQNLEDVLHWAGCSEYMNLFVQNKVDLPVFLKMFDKDFEKMGIQELGIRKKLCNAVNELNRRPWQESSLSLPNDNVFSCVQAVQMISNINAHLICMESGLFYFRKRFVDENTKVGDFTENDKHNFGQLIKELTSTVKTAKRFVQEAEITSKVCSNLTIDPRTGGVDRIYGVKKFTQKNPYLVVFGTIATIGAVGSVASFCWWKFR